jgi:hypothetical protein
VRKQQILQRGTSLDPERPAQRQQFDLDEIAQKLSLNAVKLRRPVR